MLNKEEMRILIEREGVSEFFNIMDSVWLEETECTVYELNTDYYAVMFRIFPSPYAGPKAEKAIGAAVTCGLPVNSVVQFHQICSRNIGDLAESYERGLDENLDDLALGNPEMLRNLHEAHLKFMEKHVDETVFEKTKLAFYIRDFLNTVTLLIPMRDESEQLRSYQDLVPFISKFKGSLYSMFPMDINEHQHIRIMRELLTPYNPMPELYRDPTLNIRDHYVDRNSTLTTEERGIVRIAPSTEIDFDRQDGDIQKKKAGFIDRIKRKYFGAEAEAGTTNEDKGIKETWFAKVLSKKAFPEYADLHTIVDLTMDYFNHNVQQQMPLPYFIALSVKIEDTEKVIDDVKQAAMWNKWQLDNAGSLAKYFPELRMRANEADDIINIIDVHGDIPMKASYTMVVYGKTKQDLEYNTSIIKSNHQNKGFVLQEEDLIATEVFMYSMPGKYDEIYREESKRYQTIFKSNISAITPLGTDSRGFGSEAVVQLFGRNGQPQAFDLYYRQATNKNAVVIAPSGKGKSFFTQRLVWSYLKNGAKVRIIDSGHSYKPLCDSVGGQYITFPEDTDNCLNPFTDARLDADGNIHEDEVANITNLVGIMAGYDLTETDSNIDAELVNTISSYISSAIVNAFDVNGNDAGMKEVGEALRMMLHNQKENAKVEGDIRDGDVDRRLVGLITSLQDFTNPNGIYYKYVNGRANIHFNKNLVILDLDDLSGKQKKFRDFILSSVTNTVEREFYRDRNNTQRKIFMIDEAWQLLDGKAGAVVLGLYRRARKMRGSIITITQSINDFYNNPKIQGIFENAYWRLFLQQDSSVMQTARDENRLVIDEYAFMLLETVETKVGEYSEVMIMTEAGDLMIGRTLATRVEYWVSTQDERDVLFAKDIALKFGIKEIEARICIGYAEMNKTDIEAEIHKYFGYEDRAVEELLGA